mmetsp:Transcript_42753/g.72129  ORF Transcript_42753/g.72129 Transcript_42753/m.72129 type:complete len:127 (+) Transcript_42753:1191-1571(+)
MWYHVILQTATQYIVSNCLSTTVGISQQRSESTNRGSPPIIPRNPLSCLQPHACPTGPQKAEASLHRTIHRATHPESSRHCPNEPAHMELGLVGNRHTTDTTSFKRDCCAQDVKLVNYWASGNVSS